jgi:Mg-chelatase subunit ChlD
MLQFETPEFLLLAFPLWYAFYRWGRLPAQTAWLLAVPVWGVWFGWELPADATGWWMAALAFAQTYSFALLPIPLFLGLRRWGRTAGVTQWLRLAVVVVVLFALASPRWNIGGKGIDVIVVADRSRSLPGKAESEIRELTATLLNNRKPGDRVAVVTFGRNAHIEQLLSETQQLSEYKLVVNPDGSDLDDALQKALSLVSPARPARILVLSDGEANGPSPLTTARRAREAGVPVDFVGFDRQNVGDVAVRSLTLPETILPDEPFQFLAIIESDGESRGTVRLFRESVEDGRTKRTKIRETTRRFASGRNAVRFGDVLSQGGMHRYIVEVDVADDPRPQNNRWEDEISVEAGPRVLLLVKDEAARSGRLAKLLANPKNGIPADVLVAARQPLTKLQLDRYRGVIIQDVPADQFGFVKMSRLAQFVTERGGGLLLTGGENSFGSGGYFKSPLDDILPVSMELREEHRKLRAAIAVVLDRSGSMRARVAGNPSKMDLANQGTVECVRLLSHNDMISVIAVDTAAHVVQPLERVVGKAAMERKILDIQSTGGGIYVDVALKAATEELDKAKRQGYQTRHVILFSDAQDTEISGSLFGGGPRQRYDSVIKQVESMKAAGISVSVIGMGTERDQHAGLIRDIAKAGGGNVMFTADARDLPRLFSQDTMNVARNTFLKKDDEHPQGFPGRRLPGPYLVGELGGGRFPNVDGYNLTYLKRQSKVVQAAVVSNDDYKAPWSAFWFRGLGRVAAIPFDIAGKYAGEFARWPDSTRFLLTHTAWLLGGEDPRKVFVEIEREGQDAVVTVELDPRNPEGLQSPPKLLVLPPGAEPEKSLSPKFEWADRNVLQTRFRLERLGIYRTQVVTGENKSVRGPSISLPYSPEFFPRSGQPSGRQTLAEIARLSGGTERTDVLELLERTKLPRLPRMVSLLPWLATAVVLLLLTEIAGRRLALWERRTWREETADEVIAPVGENRRWWREWKWASLRRKRSEPAKPTTPAAADTSAAAPSMSALLEQAKQRARRRHRDS